MKTLSILSLAAALTLAFSTNEQAPVDTTPVSTDTNGVIGTAIHTITHPAKTLAEGRLVICEQGRFFFMFEDDRADTEDCVVFDLF